MLKKALFLLLFILGLFFISPVSKEGIAKLHSGPNPHSKASFATPSKIPSEKKRFACSCSIETVLEKGSLAPV